MRQFHDFSPVFGIGQLTSHDGKFLGVRLQHFGFPFQNGDGAVKFMLDGHLMTAGTLGVGIVPHECIEGNVGGAQRQLSPDSKAGKAGSQGLFSRVQQSRLSLR
jgi:hypothetical protein